MKRTIASENRKSWTLNKLQKRDFHLAHIATEKEEYLQNASEWETIFFCKVVLVPYWEPSRCRCLVCVLCAVVRTTTRNARIVRVSVCAKEIMMKNSWIRKKRAASQAVEQQQHQQRTHSLSTNSTYTHTDSNTHPVYTSGDSTGAHRVIETTRYTHK